MSQVVTELTIDADTAGADRYSQAMDQVAESAGKGLSSAQGVALAIAGVSASAVGAVAGLRGFVDYVGNQTQSLVELEDHAKTAGVSVREFQEDMFAARSKGLTEKDFVSGFDKIASDIQQASQQSTEFSKLLEANGLSIRQNNGELKTAKQGMTDLMTLVQNASPAVQQQIVRIAGISTAWLPVLRSSTEEFERQKQRAADLGVIIEDSTIAKAKEFNSEWKEAVAIWDMQFKASANSILPLLTKLAGLATTIISGIGSVSGTVGRWLTPTDQMTSAQLSDQIGEAKRLREMVQGLGGSSGGDSFKSFRARTLAGSLGLPEDLSTSDVDAYIDKLQKLKEERNKRIPITPSGDGSTTLPYMGQADAVDKAMDALRKHTERQLADVQAIGLGDAALARFRAQAAETAAVQANGGKETAEQAAKFALLREQAAAAADALARAKVNSQIEFGSRTALLSQQDVQIANQLKGIYGNDVTRALNSTEAAALRTNEAFRQVSSTVESELTSGLMDITNGTKSAGQAFSDMGNAIVRAIEQMVIKILIVEPLMRSLQSAMSGIGGFSAGGGSAGGTGLSLTATGGLYHSGGIVGAEPTALRSVAASVFSGAPRFHGGGIAGDEVPAILQKGEAVFTRGQMAALSGRSSAPVVNVTLVENPNGQGTVSQQSNGNGGIDIEVAIAQISAKSASRPGGAMNRVLTDQFGARQRLASR